MERRAKIVATIGPSSQDEQTLINLVKAGMDVARLNFSHGTHETHAEVYARLRRISQELGRPVTILQDMQGPKIRTGKIENDQVELKLGQALTLTTQPIIGSNTTVPVDFPQLIESAQPGNRILLDDGNLELLITAVENDRVETIVTLAGVLKSNKGVNLPGANVNIPGFTEKDEADLEFGLELGVDAIAVSFVRTAQDIERVRQAANRLAPERIHLPIIAKLERPQALDNLEAIIQAADGVMVARGDLGVEMSPEAVPIAQKCIIQAANRSGRVVITATQMLDSMIHNPRPTRAEASDVANAILDGTDAVMLSGETASGKYPLQSVTIMNAIVCEAEKHITEWGHWQGTVQCEPTFSDDTYFMTLAARELGHDRNVAALAVFTRSGRSALLLSKTRPEAPILAFTPDPYTHHRMNLYWGVTPFLVPQVDTIDDMLRVVEIELVKTSRIQPGQQVVLVCGFPINEIRPTNMALLHTVGMTSR
ncbi:MAG: pyruvate kinase [Anaerolineales bacterium]|nr:pyruvate kinase [Anaerolineales bacterium]